MSTIEMQFDDSQVRQMLNSAMQAFGGDLRPIMKDIGEYVKNETKTRFDEERDPDGNPWKPVKPGTAARKKNPKILQEQGRRGGLLGTLNYRAGRTQVSIGVNKPYAAIHQFGGKTSAHLIKPKKVKALRWVGAGGQIFFAKGVHHPGSVIPARPYLGINDKDTEAILIIIGNWMKSKNL